MSSWLITSKQHYTSLALHSKMDDSCITQNLLANALLVILIIDLTIILAFLLLLCDNKTNYDNQI